MVIQEYHDLNPREKEMIDHCVYHNESVYNAGTSGEGFVTGLSIKGFGQIGDFGREIIFNRRKFQIIKKNLSIETHCRTVAANIIIFLLTSKSPCPPSSHFL